MVVSRTAASLQKLKDEYGKQVEFLTGDLVDFSFAQKAVDLAIKSFGQLDGLVLNHGTLGQVGKVAEADPEQWKQGFDINFISLIAFVSGPSCYYGVGVHMEIHKISNKSDFWSRLKRQLLHFENRKEKLFSPLPVREYRRTKDGDYMDLPKLL